MSDSAGIGAATFRSVPEFDLHKTTVSRAQLGGVIRDQPVGGHVKRVIDVTFSLIALMVLAPMFVLVAALVRAGLGRPVLVAEHRIGFAGQVFTTYTFRTSPIHGASEPAVATCLASLRGSELDRLPELLSVLRGDMSLVGPRPVTRDELDRRGHWAPDYFAARPGWIGLRKANRPGKLGFRRRAAFERYYIRRWSVWLDLALLVNAVASVRDVNDVS